MKILLHTCCGPCTIFPLSVLADEGNEVTTFFYNPNIHPFKEFKLRIATFSSFMDLQKNTCILDKNYGLIEFLRRTVFLEKERCTICYTMRLEKTALLAKSQGFDAFSTTLLYSKYQKHDLINSICNKLSDQFNVPYLYRDFREGWQTGEDISKTMNMYRQSYCGCIYSEQDRYDRKSRQSNNLQLI